MAAANEEVIGNQESILANQEKILANQGHHEHIVGWSLAVATLGVLMVNVALHTLFVFGQRSLPLEG